jgi:hypothetical protein
MLGWLGTKNAHSGMMMMMMMCSLSSPGYGEDNIHISQWGRVQGNAYDTAGWHAASERLYRAHDHLQHARNRQRAAQKEDELAACTFQPQVSHQHLRKETYVPIHERAQQIARGRAERISRCGSACSSSPSDMPESNSAFATL